MAQEDSQDPEAHRKKLEELKARFGNGKSKDDSPETSNNGSSPAINEVVAILQTLGNTFHHMDTTIYQSQRESIDLDVERLTDLGTGDFPAEAVRPRSPYREEEGGESLYVVPITSLQNELLRPGSPEGRLFVVNRWCKELGVKIPDNKNLPQFLKDHAAEAQADQNIVGHGKSWTFQTKIPGVAIFVTQLYPRIYIENQQRLDPTSIRCYLGFKPEILPVTPPPLSLRAVRPAIF